jgi:serine/threonine-protein kinase
VSQSKPAIPDPVQIAGRFDIVSKLGAGAFGTVFKAKDSLLGRMVAIKTIRLEGLAAQGAGIEEMLERFKREALVAAQLKHPNIVTIYDFGTDQGMSYLAMEFIDGVGLDRLIANEGKLGIERAAMLGAQVADALDFAHRTASVVHRDIKPANIMIEAGDRVKVTDFGIAKATDSGEHLTVTGSLLGTPSYMSPEQARGATLDGRSDLFALGCVVYEMVAGKKAFRGESITGLIFKIITEEPPALREIDPNVPEEMIKIISKAMAKTPETRYQTGRELADDLLALTRAGSTPTVRAAETPTAPGHAKSPAGSMAGETINTAAPTAVSPGAPSPTVQSKPTPTVQSGTAVTRQSSGPPKPLPPAARPVAPPPPSPAARKSGGGLGLLLGGAVLLLGMVAVGLGGVWWYLSKRTPATADQPTIEQPTPGGPTVATNTTTDSSATTATTAPPTADLGTTTTATTATDVPVAKTAEPATQQTAQPATQAPPTGGRTASGGTTGSTTSSGSSGNVKTADAGGRTSSGSTGSGGAAADDYSYLDEEAEPELDGEAGGRRVADAYSNKQGYGRNQGGYGTTGRLRARSKSPRDLVRPERPAVATIRYLINAEEFYNKKHGRYASLSELTAESMRLDVKASKNEFTRAGYVFLLSVKDGGKSFEITASPQTPGLRPFIGDDSGFIRSGLE